MEVKVLGTCCVKLNKQKATLLVKKRRKLKEGVNEDELLMEMSSKFYFNCSILFHLIICLTYCLGEKEARRPTPKWNTRFHLAFSIRA